MATCRITNLSSSDLQHPSRGILRFHVISRAASLSPSSTLHDDASIQFNFTFNFNPLVELRSPDTALSFVSASLTAAASGSHHHHHHQAGLGDREIILCIATFAFNQVRSRNWLYGASISVELETMYVLEEQPRSQAATPGATQIEYVYGDDYVDMLELEISELLNTQRLTGNQVYRDYIDRRLLQIYVLQNTEQLTSNQEDEECCSICLEGFRRGAMVTKLCPCSHKFHNACIVPWLCNNRTCPTCRTTCV